MDNPKDIIEKVTGVWISPPDQPSVKQWLAKKLVESEYDQLKEAVADYPQNGIEKLEIISIDDDFFTVKIPVVGYDFESKSTFSDEITAKIKPRGL
jgi:hypothetical protein